MALLVLLFFTFLLVAAVLGRVADSRDYADWRCSEDGLRSSPR
jgi:hypothetical protein